MTVRTRYELSDADLNAIYEASKPVPLIMINLGMPRSQQERAQELLESCKHIGTSIRLTNDYEILTEKVPVIINLVALYAGGDTAMMELGKMIRRMVLEEFVRVSQTL